MTKHDDRIACLEGARDLIASGWTKGAHARNSEGEPCFWGDADANCWCLTGAIALSADNNVQGQWLAADTIKLVASRISVIYAFGGFDKRGLCQWFNDDDDRTQPEVLGLLDHVIETERLI